MRLLVFDTEATGVSGAQLCQLAYVMWDGHELVAKNWYFSVEAMTEGAQQVHGLSVEDLKVLSGDRVFEDDAAEIRDDFAACPIWVGHNILSDVHLLKEALADCKLTLPKYTGICTQNYFTPIMGLNRAIGPRPKPPRLEELITFMDLAHEAISARCAEAFGGGEAAHDARWDTMATYLCLMQGAKRGLIKLPAPIDERRLCREEE